MSNENDPENAIANPIMKTETTEKLQDRSVASLKIMCPYCDESFDFPEIFHKPTNKDKGHKKQTEDNTQIASNVCPKENCGQMIPAEYISNRVQLFLKQLIVMYYKGQYKCREPSCGYTTR